MHSDEDSDEDDDSDDSDDDDNSDSDEGGPALDDSVCPPGRFCDNGAELLVFKFNLLV